MSTEPSTKPRLMGGGYTPGEVRRALWYINVAWIFGASFCAMTSGAAITSLLYKYLHASDLSFGLVIAAGPAAMLLQFAGSYVVERTGRVKRNFLLFVTTHRLIWLVVAAVPLLMPHTSHGMLVGLVGVIGFLSAALSSYGGAGWTVWMSDIIPRSLAGRFFGLRARLGLLSMCLSAVVVGWLLDRFAGQGWVYSMIFGVAALFGATDILLFVPIREAPREPEHALTSLKEIMLTPLRDPQFRAFAYYTLGAWIAYNLSGPFIWLFCFAPVSEHGMGMNAFTAQLLLVIIPWLMMAWAAPYWGRAIDRFGTKPVLMFSSLCNFVLPLGWIIMRPGFAWLIWIMAITTGLTWPGIDQVVNYMQVKGFPDTRRATYNAAYALVLGIATMIGTALGGVYAAFWQTHLYLIPGLPTWVSHYHPVILTSMVLRVACFVFLLTRLKLPGTALYTDVAREIASGLSSSLSGVGTRRQRN